MAQKCAEGEQIEDLQYTKTTLPQVGMTSNKTSFLTSFVVRGIITTFVKTKKMKFNITRQQVLPSLATLFFTCLIGVYSLIMGEHTGVGLAPCGSMLGGYVTDFQNAHRVLSAIGVGIVIFLLAINLGGLVSRNNLYSTTTHIQIPLLGMLLWAVCLNEEFLLSVLLAAFCAQIVGGFLISVRNGLILGPLFNASLLLSLLPLFYPSAVVMWGVVPIALILINVTSREWIVSFFGLLLPIATLSYIYWMMGEDLLFVGRTMLEQLLHPSNLFSLSVILPFRFLIVALGLLLSLFSLLWVGGDVHKSRVRLQIIIVMFLASLATIVSPSATMLTLPLVTPMTVVLASLALVNLNGRVVNFIYFLIMALLLLAFFVPQYVTLPLDLGWIEGYWAGFGF
ncbi:MAG: hypothetical protein SNG49_07255 [Rikenellaceae bacterium]